MAQRLAARALSFEEVAAPFPPSDLVATFHRLCLTLTRPNRSWAISVPGEREVELAETLRAVRTRSLTNLSS